MSGRNRILLSVTGNKGDTALASKDGYSFITSDCAAVKYMYRINWYRSLLVNANLSTGNCIYCPGSTLNFEGTCQLGQANLNFYLSDTILSCPPKGVID